MKRGILGIVIFLRKFLNGNSQKERAEKALRNRDVISRGETK